ncbi:MAG: DinB family protein, partial [Chitinophagales bacterium]
LPEEELQKTYGEGKWNIRQILNHLSDAETVLYDRIRRGISKPRQVIWGFDQNAWAEKLNYNTFPLEVNQNIYKSVRESIIYLANEYYEPLGDNVFTHNETGLRTLRDEFEKVAWHNQGHLEQIEIALNKPHPTT